ncbi:Cystatin [Halotydeus destructor]|nr:Cystatin [Halotydeus destructor]
MKVFVSVAILFLVATCSHARGLGQLSNIEDTKSAEFLKILNRAGDHASNLIDSEHVSKVTRLVSAQQQVVGGMRYRLEFELTKTVCLKGQNKNIDQCDVKPEAQPIRCQVELWSQVWANFTKVISAACQPGSSD